MNTSNDISALRAALFETLEGLKNGSIEIENARAINETCQTIINSAKVEVDYARATGRATGTGFVPMLDAPPAPDAGKKLTQTGVKTIDGTSTVHRMR
jgi:hypothetical protein